MKLRWILAGPVLCFLLGSLLAGGKLAPKRAIDLSQLDFRDGDIVFQHLPGSLGSVICDVTDSQFSHCGMVVHRQGEPYVLEAIGPVRYIALKNWLNQGAHGWFAQMRMKEISAVKIAAAIKSAESMLGRPYDIQYELDDDKIYCSELVYKGYLGGAGIEVGEREKLGDLNWKPHEKFIRAITGSEVPLQRIMVTPAAIARSPQLKLLYSSFPPRMDEPVYSQVVLAGKWSGEYTIQDLSPVTASVKFDGRGRFSNGVILAGDGTNIAIRELRVAPFESQREFTARLKDARGIAGELRARIRDEGRRIIGTWQDDLGHRGVFSLEKQAVEED